MKDTIALTAGNRVRFNIQRICRSKTFGEEKQHAGGEGRPRTSEMPIAMSRHARASL